LINGEDNWICLVHVQSAANDDKEEVIREMFRKISGDDLEVDPYELQNILNAVFMKGNPHRRLI